MISCGSDSRTIHSASNWVNSLNRYNVQRRSKLLSQMFDLSTISAVIRGYILDDTNLYEL